MKLAVVTNILTPYRVPLFAALDRLTEHFAVVAMAEREENRAWELPDCAFATHVLPGIHVRLPGAEAARHINYGAARLLRRLGPDVVLSGGYAPANWSALAYCKRYGRKFVSFGELGRSDATVDAVRRAIRRVMTRNSAGVIASSSEAREIFIGYGADPARLLTAPMPIDVAFYADIARAARDEAPPRDGRRAGVIAIGQLIERKGYRALFDIYERVLTEEPSASLTILGDGPKRAEYEAYVRSRAWRHVQFLGYRQAHEIARALADADVFVFPTLEDKYGAVIAEALAAGVPTVASVHAAATHDLIDDGETGFRIDPHDVESSARTVLRVLEMPVAERCALSRRGYERVRRYDITSTARAMVDFISTVADA